MAKLYEYVGPPEVRDRAAGQTRGTRITSARALRDWVCAAVPHTEHGDLIAATFVIDAGGELALADRRSEHVACVGAAPVQSAGEMFFHGGEDVEIVEVSNQSTGYCPEPESWPAV